MYTNEEDSKLSIEQRDKKRKEMLKNFQVFITMPHIGNDEFYLRDISHNGLSFYSEPTFTFKENGDINIYLYINRNIKIPLLIKIINVIHDGDGYKVGCLINKEKSKKFISYNHFVNLFYSLS